MTPLLRAVLVCGVGAFGALTGFPATAQTVYRCGASYSQVPCEGGRALDASDPRSADEKRRADAATREGLAAANRMEHERLLAEANRPPVLTVLPPPRVEKIAAIPVKAAPKTGKKKSTKKLPPDYFTAAGPPEPKPPKPPTLTKAQKAAKPPAE